MSVQVSEPLVSTIAESPLPTAESLRDPQARIAYIRRFNRFYTRVIGVLDEKHLKSGFSLAEVRVIYELAHRESATAAWLSRELGLDPGYLSRLLSGFEERGLVTRIPSTADGRQSNLSLTDEGHVAFDGLDALVRASVKTLLAPLNEPEQERLLQAMQTIEEILGNPG